MSAAITLFPQPGPRPEPRPLTKEQKLAVAVGRAKAAAGAAAQTLLRTYRELRAAVHSSTAYTADEFYAAIGPAATAQLKQWAVLAKSVINAAAPGTISDDVPEATLTMPPEG